MTGQVVLMSVRSPHVERLLAGTKTVEIRRRTWNVQPGTVVLLYAAGTVRALVGSVVVEKTETRAPSTIWRKYGQLTGLSRSEFNSYVESAGQAVAIHVRDPRVLAVPASLDELRRRAPGFRPPQSYRFVAESELGELLNGERPQLLHRLASR